jgi:hypothetical protein
VVKLPADLKSRYQEGRLVPFIGAGISMSIEWEKDGARVRGLSWAELVNQAARLLGYEDPDLLRVRGNDLQILEYFRIANNGQVAPLVNWFDREMNAPDLALRESPVMQSLARLSKCHLFYTTNYDDFVERGLRLHGRECRAIAIEAHIAQSIRSHLGAATLSTEVVKFHGDLNNPQRMVLSESDYEKRLTFTSVEDQRLKSDLLGRALLFLGYSFSDWNVSYLFRMVNEAYDRLPEAPTGRRAYIAVADPSDFEYTLFRDRNIEVIPIRGTNRAEDIAELLDGLATP